jgi:CRISPR/Cas system-associated endonuclease Cas1
MADTRTVPQRVDFRKSTKESGAVSPIPIRPRHGVVTLTGYGIDVRVERGHLVITDGIGTERYYGRFARVNHGIQRLVVVGSDGLISLAAIRWLADQNAAFVMLERNGSVLVSTGPISASDARLRRAQACALYSDAALSIARELITRKLENQETVARENLSDSRAANLIAGFRAKLSSAETIAKVRSSALRKSNLGLLTKSDPDSQCDR